MLRDLDIILFGATGFTGKNAIPFLAKLSKAKNCQLTWGIAARSKDKLQKVLSECESSLGTSASSIPLIVADIDNEQSLAEMARRTRIVINCVGPYRFLGEPVVKACIEESTHYVDVTGEPEFMEKMALKYHKAAEEKGIYVISACGMDSLVGDLGVMFLQKRFNGTVNSIEMFGRFWQEGKGTGLNYATWESAVYGVGNAKELKEVRSQLYRKRLPSLKPKLHLRSRPHKNQIVDGWHVPLMTADRSVLRRSQFLLHEADNKRPAQIETYFSLQSCIGLVQFYIFGMVFGTLTNYGFGRNLLLKYPGLFSFGVISKNPPKPETINSSWFSFTFYGEGWKKSFSSSDKLNGAPVDKAMCVRVKGRNPAYGTANICVVLSAITVLNETDKLPGNGGVLPPGYAFAKTSLVEELNENEVTFEILYEKDLAPKAKL